MKTPTRVALLSENQHLRQGQCVGMRDSEQRRIAPHRSKSPRRAAVELQSRRTATSDHLDVAPQHALRVTRAERLHGRFLRGETAGEMNSGHPPACAVGDLTLGEDAAGESPAVPFDCVGDAIDVGRVEAEPDDIGHVC